MSNLIAAIISSSVISSVINSISNSRNNYINRKIDKKLELKSERINRIRENFSKLILYLNNIITISDPEFYQQRFLDDARQITFYVSLISMEMDIGNEDIKYIDIDNLISSFEQNKKFNKQNGYIFIKANKTNKNLKSKSSALVSILNGLKSSVIDVDNIKNHKKGLTTFYSFCSSIMSDFLQSETNSLVDLGKERKYKMNQKIYKFIKSNIFFISLYLIYFIYYSFYMAYILWFSLPINESLIKKSLSIFIIIFIVNILFELKKIKNNFF